MHKGCFSLELNFFNVMTDSCNLFSFMKITVRPDPRLNDATSLVLFIDGLILSPLEEFILCCIITTPPRALHSCGKANESGSGTLWPISLTVCGF